MSGKTNRLPPKGKKIYFKKRYKNLEQKYEQKRQTKEKKGMKTCPSIVSARIVVSQNINHTG
jgi:hypothetical protein